MGNLHEYCVYLLSVDLFWMDPQAWTLA